VGRLRLEFAQQSWVSREVVQMRRRSGTRRCDGVHRRDALKVGVLSGLGLGLVDFLAGLAGATAGAGSHNAGLGGALAPDAAHAGRGGKSSRQSRAKSCILLWLDGGPSHLETFDLKPQAPAEVRGPFRPIPTAVSGIQICEHLSETARVMNHLTLLRSLTSPLGEHGLANHYLLTGYEPVPALTYPHLGAVVSALRPAHAAAILPPHVALPAAGGVGAGFLGAAHEPFVIARDPALPDFQVPDLDLFPEVDINRLERRREFLQTLDRWQERVEAQAPTNSAFGQAFRLVTSPEAKAAFDLTQESPQTRARYGPRTFGQSCLLARRLVERGVPFVTVHSSGWDTHQNLVRDLREGYAGADPGVGLIPTFDRGFAALIQDLADSGRLDETLVVAMGEFGRTPKINPQGGRDHWPRVFSAVIAGGGVRGGQVLGASDRVGESPAEQPITPKDLAFSIYSLLGLDPQHELLTPDGRPVPLNQGGQLIQGLVG